MRTPHYCILIAFLVAAINSRTLAEAAAVQKCDVNSLPATAEKLQNPGQEPIAYVFTEGVRVFNCSTGTPSPTSGGLVNVTEGGLTGPAGAESKWTGIGYYPDSDGNGTFALNEIDSKTGAVVGPEFFITLDYSTVQYLPAPDGKSLDWAVWDVFTVPKTLQEEFGIGWGSRVDTVGGEEPKDCSNIFVNNSVVVDYTAFYYFYPCPSSESNTNSSNTNSTSVSPSPEQAAPAPSTASIASAVTPMVFSVVLSFLASVTDNFNTHLFF